ncbi:11440_t:CDS:2, partial [Dentiscutata erythropus]
LHSQNIFVFQDMLKTKARSIYEQLKDGGVVFPTIFVASNSWMTVVKYENWLKWLDSQVNQPTVLLADNCHTYSSPRLKNIKLKFLPPNTTSVIQPCDASNIKNFKANYRKLLVTKWIDNIENEKSIVPINIKEAIYFISDKTPTEESIIRDILKELGLIDIENSDYENDKDEEDEEFIDDLVPYNEGKKALEIAKKYLEQSQFATENDIDLL